MFTILPESRAPRTRRLGGTVASVVAHGVLIAGAVSLTLTKHAIANVAPDKLDKTITWVTRVVPPTTPPAQGHGPVLEAAPFRPPVTHTIDVDIPTTLPPIEPAGPAVAPEDIVIGRGGSAIPGGGAGQPSGPSLGSGGIVSEHETDRAPHVLGAAPEPRYPDALRAAGLSGRVVLQFVVDTLGRAEPGSMEVQEATHPAFVDAVRVTLARFHFSPGEVGGRKVRTRVQIPFEFSLR